MGKRSSPLFTAVRRRASGRTGLPAQPCTSHQHKEGLVPAIARTLRGRDLHFVPLGPPGEWRTYIAEPLRREVVALRSARRRFFIIIGLIGLIVTVKVCFRKW